MKKIGILTYHFSENYGALFQAYALRCWFIKNGYEVSFINYQPEYLEGGGTLDWTRPVSIKNLKIIFLKYSKLKRKCLGNKILEDGFQYFMKEELGVTGVKYLKPTDFPELNFDGLVCGSDQIWNPSSQYGLDPVYFLSFNQKSNPLKIAYAPSFGKDDFDMAYSSEIISYLKGLDFISVREPSGAEIVNRLIENKPDVVPDPTVLINQCDYEEIMSDYAIDNNDYVFSYCLRSNNGLSEAASYIKNKEGWGVYSPYNLHRRWPEIGETVFPSPRQWLWLLYNSKFVLTNSFHGVMLSILLNKPFVACGLPGSKQSLNTRVLELLKNYGLEDRFLASYEVNQFTSIYNADIDWDKVNTCVTDSRSSGEMYLNNALLKV